MPFLGHAVAALAFRSATAQLEARDADLFTPSIWQNVYLGSYAFTLLGEGIGLVLLAQQRLQQRIRDLTTHDSLTGALTRAAFWDAATYELRRQQRTAQSAALLMLDLDHFKRINDTYGHQTGDRVLHDFAQRVHRVLRATDRFGRYGGEEFVVLLPDTPAAAAHAIAERIRTQAATAGLPPYTVSIGLAVLPPAQQAADADAALYQAKAQGRDRVVQDGDPA